MKPSSENIRNRQNNLFGDFVHAARERLGLSLAEAAEMIGCSKSHIWDIERGVAVNPTIGMLANICAALGLELERLAVLAAAVVPGSERRAAMQKYREAKQELGKHV